MTRYKTFLEALRLAVNRRKRPKALKEENAQFKRMCADMRRARTALKNPIGEELSRPALRREQGKYMGEGTQSKRLSGLPRAVRIAQRVVWLNPTARQY